jgi:hypothetical protein|tara:strand:- start:134 stop:370 length:237 start_codon:yes stop_codon:yes gene_type:complete
MEKLLNTIEFNILEGENATYQIMLPTIAWVNIILDNVQTIGDKHLSKEDNLPEDLVNIEFVVDSFNDDFPEEDYFNAE